MFNVNPEIINLRNLERVLAREEEVKKKAVVHKAVYDGPQIKFISRDGMSFSKTCTHHLVPHVGVCVFICMYACMRIQLLSCRLYELMLGNTVINKFDMFFN